MKVSKISDDVKDGIDDAKLKVVDVVDKAELDKHAKELVDAAVGAAQSLAEVINNGKDSWNLKRLKPIFVNDLNGMRFSRLVRIVEREKKFDFSTPYAYDHTVLVVRNDNTTITSFDDLKGKTTANSIGSTYMELGEDYGATVKGVDDLTKCMDLVKSGGVDATINAATSINDYLQTTKDSSFKIVDQSKESTPYAIPMVKGDDNTSLKKAVNKALKELKEDGTLSKISIKYFGEDLTKE